MTNESGSTGKRLTSRSRSSNRRLIEGLIDGSRRMLAMPFKSADCTPEYRTITMRPALEITTAESRTISSSPSTAAPGWVSTNLTLIPAGELAGAKFSTLGPV
jgi:hypothetical protein